MDALRFVSQLYSLDTLDTRLTTPSHIAGAITSEQSSNGPKHLRNEVKNRQDIPTGAAPSKWNTLEFYCYYAVFALVIPQMFWSVMKVSNASHPNYAKFEDKLSAGWIPGRKVDDSDSQYSGFRNNLPFTVATILIHPLLRRLYNVLSPLSPSQLTDGAKKPDEANSAAARFRQRISFDFGFAIVLSFGLHGFSALKILLILYINFKFVTQLPRAYIPAFTWIFNIGILFLNEFCHGYHFATLFKTVFPSTSPLSHLGTKLDDYGGLVSRWEILFNFTILRLISFNMDYYWSLDRSRSSSPVEKKQLDPTNLSERDRITSPSPPQTYQSVRTYLAYSLYSPLYLAGPILTFNDYISQSHYPSPSLSTKRTLMYFVRFLLVLLCMELILHYIYTVAICASDPDWNLYTPFQLSMLGYFNLHIIWLKLLIPFRIFRLWALLDGMDPPENVVRCMSDNYSALAFWRGWHRSFNRWIVRYIYVPLGGGGGGSGSGARGSGSRMGQVRGVFNTLVVFTFVALWHDINLRLLMWGWLITLFVLPEIAGTALFPASKYRARPTLYRVLCGGGAVANILMMMAANLVGFAIGIDGLQGMVQAIVGSWQGLVFLGVACATLFVAAQIMFEVREAERRKGFRLKF